MKNTTCVGKRGSFFHPPAAAAPPVPATAIGPRPGPAGLPPPVPYSPARLAEWIQDGLGSAAALHYQRAVGSPYGPLFVRHTEGLSGMAEVDAVYIDRVDGYTGQALARLVTDRVVTDLAGFLAAGRSLLWSYGMHYRIVSHHRNHPTFTAEGRPDPSVRPVRQPLVTDAVDVARLGGTADDPAERAAYRELLGRLLGEARSVGTLSVRVAQLVRRYEDALGTRHGAFRYAARYALADGGRVVGFRPWRQPPSPEPPARAVVRQARALYAMADERLRTAGRRLGFDLPPGV